MTVRKSSESMLDVAPAGRGYPPVRYAWYVVAVLTLLYVFSFIDRYVLALLVGPMRRDLAINDTEFSLLIGFGFSLCYALFGLPLGRLADSRSRRGIIAFGCLVWSVTTFGCGLVRRFWQLLFLRMGVGIGEAALAPAAYSLITDCFPQERLATAMSVYSTAIQLGTGLSFIFGGLVVAFASSNRAARLPWIGSVHPWQLVFLITGAATAAVLVLLILTVKEPARRALTRAETVASPTGDIPLREVMRYFARNRATLLCHILGYTLSSLTSYSTWGPTLFIRNFGWSAGEAGIIYGLLSAVLGVLGILAGGRVADYLASCGFSDANMRLGLIAAIAWFPTGILFPLMPTGWAALALLAPTLFIVSAPWGAAAAGLQQVVPGRMRGQVSAIYLLVLNLAGLGVAPTSVAILTDYVFRNGHALNYSLLIVGLLSHIAAAVLLWKGLAHFRESVRQARLWEVSAVSAA